MEHKNRTTIVVVCVLTYTMSIFSGQEDTGKICDVFWKIYLFDEMQPFLALQYQKQNIETSKFAVGPQIDKNNLWITTSPKNGQTMNCAQFDLNYVLYYFLKLVFTTVKLLPILIQDEVFFFFKFMIKRRQCQWVGRY